MRELVNRPFAHFTTVTLNDNTPETALEAAEQTADEAPATPAKTETQVAVTPSNEVDFDPIVEEKKAEKDDSTEETAVECTVPVEELRKPHRLLYKAPRFSSQATQFVNKVVRLSRISTLIAGPITQFQRKPATLAKKARRL